MDLKNFNLDNSWKSSIIFGLATAAITASTGLAVALLKNKNQEAKPKKWVKVGQVSKLIIYPIKSCKGVQINEAVVTKLGLRDPKYELLRDRVFMIVNKDGVFQVQKENPKMALIELIPEPNKTFRLRAPGVDDLVVNIPEVSPKNETKCRIFDESQLVGTDCGAQASAWICSFLSRSEFKLLYHYKSHSMRELSELQRKFPSTSSHDLATFQNYTSYLLIGEESISELNEHLKEKVSYLNFRPSILVNGLLEPFGEIRWNFVRIGESVILRASKPCERCSITTVDQNTGLKHPQGEPLRTLTKMKANFEDDLTKELLKNKGIMGLQMGLWKNMTEDIIIRVDDPVYVAVL